MVVNYYDLTNVNRLKTCLRMCCVPFKVVKQYEFVGGGALWKIYIDRGNLTWKQIMQTVNHVHPVRFRFESGTWNCKELQFIREANA